MTVHEFYLQPGTLLESTNAQRRFVCSNYSHVARDGARAGINVIAQLVSPRIEVSGTPHYSLSCNPDVTLDLVDAAAPRPVMLVGQTHVELPPMLGDAMLPAGRFAGIVDDRAHDYPLFGTPSPPVGNADIMIGLYASALVPDRGTLQLGIGSMGDAVAHLLRLRHESTDAYQAFVSDAKLPEAMRRLVEREGGTAPFSEGLYAASEMLSHGLFELYRCGVEVVEEAEGVARLGHVLDVVACQRASLPHAEGARVRAADRG